VPEDDAVPAVNYKKPSTVWAVEYTDERQPGWRFQAGAFTTEAEARRLLRKLDKAGTYGELLINVIPVHRTVEDSDLRKVRTGTCSDLG
jgi:cell division septation protein DedD